MKISASDHRSSLKPVACATLILALSALFFPVHGFPQSPATTLSADTLLSQDIPIYYGEEDFRERIADPPSGRRAPLGVLLSGGSARAFAHIGVLKALDERGLSPDFIVTNSMGSIIGIMYGAGLSPEEIFLTIKRVQLSSLLQPELPFKGGLLNTRLFSELINNAIPYEDLGELPIPVMVVVEDLASKRTVVLAEGTLEKVFPASFALPVYFKPVEFREHTLIDGGISNLAPVQIPYRYTEDVITATTFYRRELAFKNPITILNVAMDIGKARSGIKAIKQYDPLWIRCNVETYSFMDWANLDEIVRRGYESADTFLETHPEVVERLSTNSDHLAPVRKRASKSFERAIGEYTRIRTVRFSPPEWGVRAGLQAEGGPESHQLLHSRNRLSAGTYLRSGFGHLEVKSFYQPAWLNLYQMEDDSFYGLSAQIEWLPAGLFRISAAADINAVPEPQGLSSFDSFYGKGSLSIPLRSGERSLIAPFLRGEYTADARFIPEEWAAVSGISVHHRAENRGDSAFNGSAGLFLNSRGPALQMEASAELPLTSTFVLRQRLFSRSTPASPKRVPYYPGDYYRGSFEQELLPDFIIGNSALALRFPGWNPTFGEALILDSFSVGPFFDYRGSKNNFTMVYGGALDASLSLIGLSPLSVHLDYGLTEQKETRISFYLSL